MQTEMKEMLRHAIESLFFRLFSKQLNKANYRIAYFQAFCRFIHCSIDGVCSIVTVQNKLRMLLPAYEKSIWETEKLRYSSVFRSFCHLD